ncbi:MAG: transcriptional regulator NrdR [Candidatus Omnitrophica bacterium]|nr:transcriptional regulator NrdR [Candidatus Omnitrophota bacterium]
MRCPYCGSIEDKVIDSRESPDGSEIRRRRECLKCARRSTTYERLEESPLLVVKRDGRREPYEKRKVLNGVVKACEKRPISMEAIETLVDEVDREIRQEFEKEVSSTEVGERVMGKLQKLDDVAYVRFASVYRSFKDLNQFMRELRDLLNSKK